ncbi:MAG: exodeoxyribonuclease VII large subunit [Woeseiaceae bacterium]|nr:exodeoxyribonuclease VII large subunit [Woeseiaceae bacterium]
MKDLLSSTPAEAAVSVSQLNRRAKALLEQGIAKLWVEGEISNLARPASGHLYFSLKDDAAQIRAAFFRQRQRGPTIGLKNGDKVLAFGRVSLYEARGDYQLIVEQVEPAGEGALKREFDRLKKKLAAEGLFDESLKQPLPALPTRIGVITSPSGAAVRDVLTVLGRRFRAVPVVIYPAAVQGDFAPAELRAALEAAIRRDECDVLILCRGGGSLEDLWAFNDERLARAIADCPIPVVSAVGHEVDFTIADFVADVRAPTPSGAAEIVVPDRDDWLHRLNALAARIRREGRRSVEEKAQSLDWLGRRLVRSSPAANLQRQHDRLRALRSALAAALRHDLLERRRDLESARAELLRRSPALTVQRSLARLAAGRQRLAAAAHGSVGDARHRLELAMRSLHSVSPLATLDRGYAIVLDEQGRAVTNAADVAAGDRIRARLSRGSLVADVVESRHGDNTDDVDDD